MTLALGQRWVSDTESELGLGTIVALDHRMVTLLFLQAVKTVFYDQRSPNHTGNV